MARYERFYDYGLRGYRETAEFRRAARTRPVRYGYDFGFRGNAGPSHPNRVTARYNEDYTYGNHDPRYERDRYPVHPQDDPRIIEAGNYERPYHTIGGTHTQRGRYRSTAPAYDRDYRYGRDFERYDRDIRRRY